ncbi:MAG: carbohydrate binding family 9 domain-containing protein, partial [Candidatus Marinimicrobia bacterium]|nr:carbohydrate binding family 9 domain-containing protein [Candidatus Neomarinimicrobiota bacterium]
MFTQSKFCGRLLYCSLALLTLVTASQSDVTAHRLNNPMKIDGQLIESIYSKKAFNYFIQTDPDNGALPTESTEIWVGFDDEAIYVGWRLLDSKPEEIVSRLTRRDSDFNSDEIQFAIDSYNDNRSGFYFIVNPAGSIQDGTIANDGWFDDTWDGIWDRAARIDDQGWTVEMRIPFSQLRFNMRDEIVMGIGLGRVIKRNNEHDLSFLTPRGESGVTSRFGDLLGIRNIHPPKRIEIIPYITANIASLPSEKDNPFYHGQASDFGIGTDLKLGIGNNLTIDATIIPDFGQVEVDPSVINLSAYETYYD